MMNRYCAEAGEHDGRARDQRARAQRTAAIDEHGVQDERGHREDDREVVADREREEGARVVDLRSAPHRPDHEREQNRDEEGGVERVDLGHDRLGPELRFPTRRPAPR